MMSTHANNERTILLSPYSQGDENIYERKKKISTLNKTVIKKAIFYFLRVLSATKTATNALVSSAISDATTAQQETNKIKKKNIRNWMYH